MPLPPQTLDRLAEARCPIPLNSPGGEPRAVAWLADHDRRKLRDWLSRAGFVVLALPVAIVGTAAGAAAGVLLGLWILIATSKELCRLLRDRFSALFRP